MKINPAFSDNIYTGEIGPGLTQLLKSFETSGIFVLADENTMKFCFPLLENIRFNQVIIISPGELHKNLDSCKHIWTTLIDAGADRTALLLNLGGGMICDLGGFAASCYQRGIRFAHIPTSVLAMADAAIGGKTGIDYEGLKNYIGIIRKPDFIWIDPVFLQTLPLLEKKSGLTEIVKHAIIGSRELWNVLAKIDDFNQILWPEILEKSIRVKLKITESDPLEKGIRKVLNFGHTSGHAIESHYLNSDNPLTHGQSICLGMLVETRISYITGLLDKADFRAIVSLFDQLLNPVQISLPTFAELRGWMSRDKKNSGDGISFSLPDGIGSCRWDIIVEDEVISKSFDWLGQALTASRRLSVE